MKQILHFACIFLFVALTPPLLAQQNEIALDTRAWGCDQDLVTGASLHYYLHTGARGSIGAAVHFNTTQFGNKADYPMPYTQTISLNLVRRFNLSKSTHVRWNVEAGLSGLAMLDRYPPHSIFVCGTGLTEEQAKTFADQYENGYTEANYHFGVATGSSLLFKFGKNWWGGLTASGDWYWDKEWNEPGLLINPGVQISRTF